MLSSWTKAGHAIVKTQTQVTSQLLNLQRLSRATVRNANKWRLSIVKDSSHNLTNWLKETNSSSFNKIFSIPWILIVNDWADMLPDTISTITTLMKTTWLGLTPLETPTVRCCLHKFSTIRTMKAAVLVPSRRTLTPSLRDWKQPKGNRTKTQLLPSHQRDQIMNSWTPCIPRLRHKEIRKNLKEKKVRRKVPTIASWRGEKHCRQDSKIYD